MEVWRLVLLMNWEEQQQWDYTQLFSVPGWIFPDLSLPTGGGKNQLTMWKLRIKLSKKSPAIWRALKKWLFNKRGCFHHRKQPLLLWRIRIGGGEHFPIDDSQSLYFICRTTSLSLKDFFSALAICQGLFIDISMNCSVLQSGQVCTKIKIYLLFRLFNSKQSLTDIIIFKPVGINSSCTRAIH